MRMYTSYRGIRSTGGAAAPSGSRFRKCVLTGTPSLKTLIELPIGVVAAVRPPRPLLGEPDVEPRRDEPVGALLALRRADREVVGILVLRVTGVPLDQRGVAAGARLGAVVPEAALVGVDQHADRGGRVRAG